MKLYESRRIFDAAKERHGSYQDALQYGTEKISRRKRKIHQVEEAMLGPRKQTLRKSTLVQTAQKSVWTATENQSRYFKERRINRMQHILNMLEYK